MEKSHHKIIDFWADCLQFRFSFFDEAEEEKPSWKGGLIP